MREYWFRAKIQTTKTWIEGFYVHVPCGIKNQSTHIIQPIGADGRMSTLMYVDPDTVGQYTGRSDVKNVKIFEGDILRVVIGASLWGIGVVLWDDHDQCYNLFTKVGRSELLCPLGDLGREEYLEIIGNIHDNPDLLEVMA